MQQQLGSLCVCHGADWQVGSFSGMPYHLVVMLAPTRDTSCFGVIEQRERGQGRALPVSSQRGQTRGTHKGPLWHTSEHSSGNFIWK